MPEYRQFMSKMVLTHAIWNSLKGRSQKAREINANFGCRNLRLSRLNLIDRVDTTDMTFLNFYICFSRSNRFFGDKFKIANEIRIKNLKRWPESFAELKSCWGDLQLARSVVFEMIPPNSTSKTQLYYEMKVF